MALPVALSVYTLLCVFREAEVRPENVAIHLETRKGGIADWKLNQTHILELKFQQPLLKYQERFNNRSLAPLRVTKII